MSIVILKESLEPLASSWGKIGKIWVACSGGADSVALVRALAEYIKKKQLASRPEISVLHFNHQLRGAESEGDQAFVEELAAKLEFSLHVERLEWGPGETRSQTTAREKRRACLARLLGPRDVLLLGHHADDQAETLLFRLLRGTGVRGLQGMRIEAGALWRPFLRIQRSQIRSALKQWGQNWREDSSNQKKSYDRNWLRLEIIPKLEERRPGVSRRLALLAETISQELLPESHLIVRASSRELRLFSQKKIQASKLSELIKLFGLSAKGALSLQSIAKKPEWRFSTKNHVISCSQGFVFVAPKTWQNQKEKRRIGGTYVLRSELGTWRVRSDTQICWRAELARGQGGGLKKRAQKLAIPQFWRDAVPLFHEQNYLWPVLKTSEDFNEKVFEWTLEPAGSSAISVRYSPSPLARSWLKEKRPSS